MSDVAADRAPSPPDPHPASSSLAWRGAVALGDALARGDLRSTDLVSSLVERAALIDEPAGVIGLGAWAALDPAAMAVAAERDVETRAGRSRGPLHGLPVVIKDNIEAVGLPGWAGSSALRGRPSRDAPLVSRLRAAGAVILASTNLSQWANIRSSSSTSGYSATGGLVANPYALDRSAGGSSSGSGAAVAAGLAPLAVGTETDGSIVCPASLCGLVGIKPTVGAVPAEHVVPISASQDSPGPLGRSVADVRLLLRVLTGTAPAAPSAPRLAVATTWRTGHDATDALFDAVVAQLATAHPVLARAVAVPGQVEQDDELTVLLAELVDDLSAYLAGRPGAGVRSLADVVAYEDAHPEIEMRHFGHDLFERALTTGGRAGPLYGPARERNLAWARGACLEPALDQVEVLLAPAYGPAWKSDLVLGDRVAASPATMPAAIAGWPIATVPLGLVAGLPVGAALLGRPGSEWQLLEAAGWIEDVVAGAVGRPGFTPGGRG